MKSNLYYKKIMVMFSKKIVENSAIFLLRSMKESDIIHWCYEYNLRLSWRGK
jgi:hypothetical protein